jgi:hypothetical protein
MQDACEPLLAIADLFGGKWPTVARRALVRLCASERLDDAESVRVRLLEDIKTIFLSTNATRMTTAKLLRALHKIPEAPWGGWYGRQLEARDLASLLKPYGVASQSLRLKSGRVVRGYKRERLEDAWKRYARGSDDG